MDIICRKTKCVYNKDYTCQAKNILVGQKVNCETFVLDENKKNVQDASRKIFTNEDIKYAPHRTSKRGCIECKANCMFNCKNICESNGITLNALKGNAYCVSFLKET